jgi:hypothetical protein
MEILKQTGHFYGFYSLTSGFSGLTRFFCKPSGFCSLRLSFQNRSRPIFMKITKTDPVCNGFANHGDNDSAHVVPLRGITN